MIPTLVKVISAYSPEKLQDLINEFLIELVDAEKPVIDIKFSTTSFKNDAEYTALIIYKSASYS